MQNFFNNKSIVSSIETPHLSDVYELVGPPTTDFPSKLYLNKCLRTYIFLLFPHKKSNDWRNVQKKKTILLYCPIKPAMQNICLPLLTAWLITQTLSACLCLCLQHHRLLHTPICWSLLHYGINLQHSDAQWNVSRNPSCYTRIEHLYKYLNLELYKVIIK